MPPKTEKPIDIDALIEERRQKNIAGAKKATVTVGGRVWHVSDTTSLAAAFMSSTGGGSGDSIMDWLLGYVAEDEVEDFRSTLNKMRGLDGELFGEILNTIVEAVTDRPTEPTPASTLSSAKKAGARSTEPSSSTAVEDSLD